MQIIIILLVIIIFILAPWMMVVAAGIAATYGIYIVAFTGLVGLVTAIALLRRRSASGSSSSMRAAIRKANSEAKRKSDLAWADSLPGTEKGALHGAKDDPHEAPETIRVCGTCQVEVLPGKTKCSSCGKQVI